MALRDNPAKVYDVVIIGAGPSGLACALTLGRVRRSVLVFDSQQYRNARADYMQAFPTNEGRSPAAYLEMARDEVRQYPCVDFAPPSTSIVAVSKEPLPSATVEVDTSSSKGDAPVVFRVAEASGRSWVGRFLVLATGVIDVLPSIPGFEENWGSNILHCIYCHGYEHRDQSAGVIGGDFVNVSSALTSATLFVSITLFSNGGFPRVGPKAEALKNRIPDFEKLLAAKNVSIDHRIIESVVNVSSPGNAPRMELHFADGSTAHCDVLLHVPPTAQRAAAIGEQLGLPKAADGSWELTHPGGKTSLDSLYTTGDAAQVFKAVSNAVFTGMAAGTMIHHELSFRR